MTAGLSAGHLAAADQAHAYAAARWAMWLECAGQLLTVIGPTQACVVLCGLLCRDLGVDPQPGDPATTAIAVLAAAAVREAGMRRAADRHDR